MDIRKWWKAHKYDVLCIGTLLLTTIGIGAAVYSEKKRADAEAEEAMKRLHETIGDITDNSLTVGDEHEMAFEEKEADPNRQLSCGGYWLDRYDNAVDLPEIIFNDIPVSKMGEFGEEIRRMYIESHPNWEENGEMNPDKLLTSNIVCIESIEDEEKKEDKAA